MSDVFDSIGDVAEFAGSLNAVLNPLISNPNLMDQLADGVLPGIDSCLTELLVGLVFMRRIGLDDIGARQFALDALVNPVRDLLTEIFVPDLPSFDGLEDFASYAQEFAMQIVESMKNPVSAILSQQRQVIRSSLDQIGDKLISGVSEEHRPGNVREFFDTARVGIETLLFRDDEGISIFGLLKFAITLGLPGIDSEIRYLRQMKRQVNTSMELATTIPDAVIPQLPALGAVNRICNAEEDLKIVASDLRNRKTWNRSRFGSATEAVCDSAQILRSGILPSDVAGVVGGLFNLDDRQINALKTFRYAPDPRFRLALLQLRALHGFAQEQDVYVVALHRNIRNFMTVLNQVTRVHIADVMSLLIEVLREQIRAVRYDLESQAQGFTGNLAAAFPDKTTDEEGRVTQQITNPPSQRTNGPRVEAVRGETPEPGAARRNTKYAVDIYAQLSGQATGYVVLETLCYMMRKVQFVYNNIDRILAMNTRFMESIRRFIDYYEGDDCPGSEQGGERITNAVDAYLDAAESRLRNDTQDNRALSIRADTLVSRIDEHIEWLECIRERMVFGNENILRVISAIANVFAAIRQIAGLLRTFRQLYQLFRTFDIRKLLSRIDLEFSAVEVVLRAIQCFILQCDNSYIRQTLRLAQSQFRVQLASRTSQRMDLGTLDSASKNADKSNLNTRISALLRLLQNLQSLASLDVNALCELRVPGRPGTGERTVEDITQEMEAATGELKAEARDQQLKREQKELEEKARTKPAFSAD